MLNKHPHPVCAFPELEGAAPGEMLNWVKRGGAPMDEILGQHWIMGKDRAHRVALKDV